MPDMRKTAATGLLAFAGAQALPPAPAHRTCQG